MISAFFGAELLQEAGPIFQMFSVHSAPDSRLTSLKSRIDGLFSFTAHGTDVIAEAPPPGYSVRCPFLGVISSLHLFMPAFTEVDCAFPMREFVSDDSHPGAPRKQAED